MLHSSGTPRRWRATATATAVASVFGLGLTFAEPAAAAPSCTSGWVCFWTSTDGGGTKYPYEFQANHTHATASVFYNYENTPISFWTGPDGTGDVITHYTLSQRGFRNWSSSNWNRCRSHRDYY